MKGYCSKTLRIDLSLEKISVEKLEKNIAEKFIGGSGLTAITLYNDLSPVIKPLSPDNEIIFGFGPLVATPFYAANRTIIISSGGRIRERRTCR